MFGVLNKVVGFLTSELEGAFNGVEGTSTEVCGRAVPKDGVLNLDVRRSKMEGVLEAAIPLS